MKIDRIMVQSSTIPKERVFSGSEGVIDYLSSYLSRQTVGLGEPREDISFRFTIEEVTEVAAFPGFELTRVKIGSTVQIKVGSKDILAIVPKHKQVIYFA